jgi:phosphoserine phosphatase RsbU/P
MEAQAQQAARPILDAVLHEQLLDRRRRLERARPQQDHNADFTRLLNEVDEALLRFEQGTYGICEECHDPIEADRLLADPLIRVCLGDLSEKQRRSLEDDLQLAAEIQNGLLPKAGDRHASWKAEFVYQPAGIVSGDYVDVIPQGGDLYFILGDVSGKGMAASLLMSSLHAMFHSLLPLGLPLCDLMSRANRLLCESSLANQFATLVVGKASADGTVEICNAGHLPPLVLRNGGHAEVNSAGLPLGMFHDVEFESSNFALSPNETLLLYSDGVTEAMDESGSEFGVERLLSSVDGGRPSELVKNCLASVESFRGLAPKSDDLTIMALQYAGTRG